MFTWKISGDNLKKLVISILVAAFVLILTQNIFFSFKPINDLESKLIDSRFKQRGPIFIYDSTDVIIIEISQDTYDQIPSPYNSWPWPRSLFAKLVNNLSEAGVKAIGIDLMMTDEDRYSPANDSLLMDAIKSVGNVVVAGKLDVTREAILSDYSDYEMQTAVRRPEALVRYLNEKYGNIFYEADSSIGIAQIPLDNDGIARRYYPYVYSGITDRLIPTFSLAVLNKFFDLPNDYIAKNADGNFEYYFKKLPKFDESSVIINFYGYNRSFPHYKFIDVIDDKDYDTKDELELGVSINTWDDPVYGYLHSGIFNDKIVLIGSTMPEDKDLFPVSIGKGEREGDNLLYGVEIHANIIQNILTENFLYTQSKFIEILSIFLLTIFAFFASSNLKLIKIKYGLLIEFVNLVVVIFLIFFINLLSVYFFINHNYLIAVVNPSLAIVAGYVASTVYHFVTERKKNLLIKSMFSQYVSGELVNELLADPEKSGLGGVKKFLTILFCDIAEFTSFSENKTPEELVKFMNEFLGSMTEVVMANNGTLDKYLGDAVMAFWGAPISLKDHALLSCKSALTMQKKVEELRKKWDESLSIRIGINSAEVIVGNIGGEKRFDYTVMGDGVNLASRLESANKTYGTSIMISESTYSEVGDNFIVREIDTIKVKGRKKPTKVFELLSLKENFGLEDTNSNFIDYNLGITQYKLMNFSEAKTHFTNSLEKYPEDPPSKIYLNRCNFYMQNPPEENWDGVFIMKTK